MINKKGEGLSIGVIIGIILVLLVLLVIFLIFRGQFNIAFTSFGQSFKHIFTLSNATNLTLK